MVSLILVLLAYLFGSLPIPEYLARRKGVDLRKAGTGKPGPGNLWQTTGAINGMVGGLSDFSKGFLPPLIARALGLSPTTASIAAVAGLVGQMWPVFRKFDGGRGNSTALGLALALSPRAFLLTILPMLTGGALWSYPVLAQRHIPWRMRIKLRRPPSSAVPIGMFAGWLGLPLFALLLRESRAVSQACLATGFLIFLRRVTAELGSDLRSDEDIVKVLRNRLLYDREAK